MSRLLARMSIAEWRPERIRRGLLRFSRKLSACGGAARISPAVANVEWLVSCASHAADHAPCGDGTAFLQACQWPRIHRRSALRHATEHCSLLVFESRWPPSPLSGSSIRLTFRDEIDIDLGQCRMHCCSPPGLARRCGAVLECGCGLTRCGARRRGSGALSADAAGGF